MNQYKVKIRRDLARPVRPEAEQLDGRIFVFTEGWMIDDLHEYDGESAMIPLDKNYPHDAPLWIASGDLVTL